MEGKVTRKVRKVGGCSRKEVIKCGIVNKNRTRKKEKN
jgi:hypothetical protein